MSRAAAPVLCVILLAASACRSSTLPYALGDREFWGMIEAFSEPPGAFPLSENLVSNEPRYADSARWLRPAGGVFIGVGPEQNFSYVAGLRPRMAFVVDIRRENLDLHLLYKALFELSVDRADFVSRLFSRPRPSGLGPRTSVDEIFQRYDSVAPSPELHAANASLIRERLLSTRSFPLASGDLEWIERAHKTFCASGPALDYYGASKVNAVRPSYRELMTARDPGGQHRSFLATEDGFAFVKALQTRNMIVPIVGDFAGPKAIRQVGAYVREHHGRVQAFYGSNVGVYLTTQQTYAYCANLATLPASAIAWFIDSQGMRPLEAKVRGCLPVR